MRRGWLMWGLAAGSLLAGALSFGGAAEVARAGDVHVAQGGFLLNFDAPVTSLRERRFKAIIRQKYDYSCGSAALAAFLTFHYERPVDEETVFRAMFETGDQESIKRNGFSFLDMKSFLEKQHLQAEGYQMPLEKIAQLGVPVITLINVGGYRHFVIIKGMDDNNILMGDPVFGVQVVKKEIFTKVWDGVVLVVRNEAKRGKAHFNLARDWAVRQKAPFGTAVNHDALMNFTTMDILPGSRTPSGF
jgi:predicted double-glycine peptidase